ncbi:complement C1q-like protein 4 [Mya arenaria]|uniref:complement C1q-like protein 4 n=1 Tax=Mya arenaria TaxID=6604 RepID=UPI0022DEBB9A|nr:complement C1q-like protein 4 [Mya arenaria]
MTVRICVTILCLSCVSSGILEPRCTRFEYDEQLLEKAIRMEIRLVELAKTVENLQIENKNLKESVDNNSASSLALQDGLERLRTVFNTNTVDISPVKHKDPRPAFLAILSNDIRATTAGHTIVFDDVVTNIGSAYNGKTGTFTAPIEGLYLFSVKITGFYKSTASSGTTDQYQLKLNNNLYLRLYTNVNSGTHSFDSSSVVTVLELGKGDRVNVDCQQSDKYVEGSSRNTFFSGFLIE